MLSLNDVYEVACSQQVGGSTILNVLHFRLRGTLTTPQTKFQTVANDIKEMVRAKQAAATTWTSWRATQVSGAGITYDNTTCRRSGGDFYEGNFTGTLTGADVSGATGPSYEAVVVALKSGVSGRSKRGQFFIGGLDANALKSSNRNELADSYVTAWQAAVDTFYAKYFNTLGTDPDFSAVVWSRFIASGCKYTFVNNKRVLTHVQAGDQANSWVHVTSATVRRVIAPMNRRKQGRGV